MWWRWSFLLLSWSAAPFLGVARPEQLVLMSPSSDAFAARPEFHLSAKSADVVTREGEQVDLTCRTSAAWHLCSWRAPGDGDVWCDRLSTDRYAQSCHGDDRIRFQTGIDNQLVSPDHGDCAITIVGVRGTDSGLWKCMVKDSVRAEEVWTEEVSVTVASPYSLDFLPLEEGGSRTRPLVKPDRPANESDHEITCRALGEGAVDPDLIWTVNGVEVASNRTRKWQEEHSDGRRLIYLSLPLQANLDLLSHDATLRCLSKQRFPNGTVIYESSVATKMDVITEPVVQEDEKSESNVGEIVVTVIIILLIIAVIVLICVAQKKKLWCYKDKRRRPVPTEDNEEGISIPREPPTGEHAVAAEEGENRGLISEEGENRGLISEEGENRGLISEETATRMVAEGTAAAAAAATSASSTSGEASTARTQETDDRSNGEGNDDGNVRPRPAPIDLPSAGAADVRDSSGPPDTAGTTGTVATSQRSPIPPPSAPPMEEHEANPYAFIPKTSSNSSSSNQQPPPLGASPALPEDRLRQLIAAPRVISPVDRRRARFSSSALHDDDDEEAAASYNSHSQPRPLSVPIFRQFQLPGSGGGGGGGGDGPPSARGLSEVLVTPRRQQVRRGNEYVKIKPRSMEVVTTTVEENGDDGGGETNGHYSSIDDLGLTVEAGPRLGAAAAAEATAAVQGNGITAAVDVHNEMSYADDDATDDEEEAAGAAPPSSPPAAPAATSPVQQRPPPSETAL